MNEVVLSDQLSFMNFNWGNKMGDKKEKERKEMLKKIGYFTVNDLLQKLQELKEKGFGDELVGSDLEHYKICEYDNYLKYVVIE